MLDEKDPPNARRTFVLKALTAGAAAPTVAALAGTAALQTPTAAAQAPAPALPAAPPEAAYQSLGPSEAAFVEALVNLMCPADELTANGVDCGLAIYIDRQLAGGFGKGARLYTRGPWRAGKPQHGYQWALLPDDAFKLGISMANAECRRRHARSFEALSAADADAFLRDVAAGRGGDSAVLLKTWFDELVYPLFIEACFADPMYGGNRDKVFWKAIGYPGLPATHTRDMVEFRGKPFPAAAAPKSIADFS